MTDVERLSGGWRSPARLTQIVQQVVDIQPHAPKKGIRKRAVAVAFLRLVQGGVGAPNLRVGTQRSACDNQAQTSSGNGFLGFREGKYEGKYSKKPLFQGL